MIIWIYHHYSLLSPRARTILTTTELRDDRHPLQQRQQQQLEEAEATSAVDLVLCFVYPKNVIWLRLLCRLRRKERRIRYDNGRSCTLLDGSVVQQEYTRFDLYYFRARDGSC